VSDFQSIKLTKIIINFSFFNKQPKSIISLNKKISKRLRLSYQEDNDEDGIRVNISDNNQHQIESQ